MRELFVTTVKNSKSSRSYVKNELQTQQPTLKFKQTKKYKEEKIVEVSITKDMNKKYKSNLEYSPERIKEIKPLAMMYLMQLQKLEKEMALLKELNPLFQDDLLMTSVESFSNSILIIERAIKDNNIDKLSSLLSDFY